MRRLCADGKLTDNASQHPIFLTSEKLPAAVWRIAIPELRFEAQMRRRGGMYGVYGEILNAPAPKKKGDKPPQAGT